MLTITQIMEQVGWLEPYERVALRLSIEHRFCNLCGRFKDICECLERKAAEGRGR